MGEYIRTAGSLNATGPKKKKERNKKAEQSKIIGGGRDKLLKLN